MASVNVNEMNSDLRTLYGISNPSNLLSQAIAEDSNVIVNWMWYAEQVTSNAESHYCYERVLNINPHHADALAALETLSQHNRSGHGFANLFRAWMGAPLLRGNLN